LNEKETVNRGHDHYLGSVRLLAVWLMYSGDSFSVAELTAQNTQK